MRNKITKFIMLFLCFLMMFSTLSFTYATTSEIDKLTIGAEFQESKNSSQNKQGDEVLVITVGGLEKNEEAGLRILSEYRNIVIGISGVAALTCVILFIINFLKLAKSSDNPQERQGAIMGIVLTGVGAAGSGGVLIFVSFFYNLFL